MAGHDRASNPAHSSSSLIGRGNAQTDPRRFSGFAERRILNLIRVINEVIDLDEISSWRTEPSQLLLSFRNGATVTVELRDPREQREIMQLFQPIQDKKTV